MMQIPKFSTACLERHSFYGLILYMRTEGVTEVLRAARRHIKKLFQNFVEFRVLGRNSTFAELGVYSKSCRISASG